MALIFCCSSTRLIGWDHDATLLQIHLTVLRLCSYRGADGLAGSFYLVLDHDVIISRDVLAPTVTLEDSDSRSLTGSSHWLDRISRRGRLSSCDCWSMVTSLRPLTAALVEQLGFVWTVNTISVNGVIIECGVQSTAAGWYADEAVNFDWLGGIQMWWQVALTWLDMQMSRLFVLPAVVCKSARKN